MNKTQPLTYHGNRSLSLLVTAALLLMVAGCGEESPPSREGMVELEDTQLYYQEMGSGEPLMVVHGGPLLDHGYLEPSLRELAANYRLIFMDQRLSGRSSAESDSASIRISRFVEDIEALRRHLGLERVHLLGHSWGGYLALNYALEYPGSLHSLVLVSPMPPSSEQWQREEQVLAGRLGEEYKQRREEIMQSEEFSSDPNAAREKLLRLSFRNQFYEPELADSLRFYLPENYGRRSELFGLMMRDLSTFDLYPRLDAMKTPTLLIYGDQEPGLSIGGAAMDSTLPASRLVVLDRSGHFSFMERPEAFRETLGNFLSAPGARANSSDDPNEIPMP